MSGHFLARNWANDQNLVESTKMERHIVDPKKAHRKDKVKKEKRKDKKGKHVKTGKSLERSVKHDKKLEQQYPPFEKILDESEQLEKSGLTEELEQPQNLCYLSDGSQSNNKRKRQDSPAVDSHVKAVPGKPLRIRFVFRKPKEPEAVRQEEPVCSISGAQCITQKEKIARDSEVSGVPSAKSLEEEESLPSTSGRDESDAVASTIDTIDTRKKKHKKSKKARYDALFEEWAPPSLSSAVLDADDDDQDWLFGSRRQEKPVAEAVETADKGVSMNSRSSGGSSWPKAHFLPEVGIYSLPYTIPF